MHKSIKSTKRWWHEGKEHIKAKQIIKDIAKKYGCGCVEEERFEIDLHEVEPELFPKHSVRGYQADLYISKRRGHSIFGVIAEIDGGYHDERKEKDQIRDRAIIKIYASSRDRPVHKIARFERDMLLVGSYTEEQIVEALGI